MVQQVAEGFEARLAAAAATVDARLALHLDRAGAAGTPARLLAAMRHGVLVGGKRFRPFLVLETAAMLGGIDETALDAAAALELVHAYSLVHDDLPAMDNDMLRRGQPTVWKAFDDWTAVLAGDALLTLAFEILDLPAGSAGDASGAARRLALVGRIARAAGSAGMVGGQTLDLEAEKLGLPRSPDRAHVRRLQALKTGALITCAAEAGALAAGSSGAVLAAMRAYGEALGLAFQISDDLLDVTGDVAVVGKAVGKDQALGKATLVAVLGEAAAQDELAAAVAAACTALDGFGDKAEPLREAARFQLRRRH